ncbi:DNA-processing protein DprA [Leuconostocaceae bacterium ESL0723]|nr:DNA-processing protein DprA [Leuconostocaceae bacterium ESL0723]
MDFKHFILALHLTAGIGKQRATRIIRAINHGYAPVTYPWPLDVLTNILEVSVNTAAYQQISAAYGPAIERAQAFNQPFMTYYCPSYPERLRQIYEPPLVLFYRGDLRALSLPSLSVVGTRTASPYSLNCLRVLLPRLIKTGTAIVSGLAKGVDVMAHQITFAQQGVPIAVVGTGIDIAYPGSHHSLQEQVGQQGLLLSEYPAKVGPRRGHFPDRNRIIAGLSAATLIVEAKQESGSLITANCALQNNRQVLAVPGSIFSSESEGTNQLIAAGAVPVLSVEDLLTTVKRLD